MTDRVKESLFGSLGASVEGARVLDLYAGSGALGIEALSRGASMAVSVERDRRAAAVIADNVDAAGFSDVARVQARDVAGFLTRSTPPDDPFTLVFCDPPYDLPTEDVEEVLRSLAERWVTGGAVIVVRRRSGDVEPTLPGGWRFVRRKSYGDTLVLVATAA